MPDELTLVLGATGRSGRRVAERLRAAGVELRAASRSGEVRFDWSDPATWEPAVSGVGRMYLMAPDGVPVDPAFVRGSTRACGRSSCCPAAASTRWATSG